MTDPNAFARRYITMWNEPDADLRRKMIIELFAPDAVHYTPSQQVRGHLELEMRVITAYERWVAPGVHAFRAVPNANGHHNAVRFNWEMVTVASGDVNSVGFDFIVLNDEGLITTDYQFVDS